MGDFQFITWNVNGLLDRRKRGAVLRCIKRIDPAVALLQETHLLGTKSNFLGRFGYNRVVHAGFSRGSSGSAILIQRSFPFTQSGSHSDPLRRFDAIWDWAERRAFNFISVYIPPQMHASTFQDQGVKTGNSGWAKCEFCPSGDPQF